jgi:hypothetical protein
LFLLFIYAQDISIHILHDEKSIFWQEVENSKYLKLRIFKAGIFYDFLEFECLAIARVQAWYYE